MKRRRTLVLVLLVPALATGHTPFRQWTVYRRKHLLILTDKTQPGSFELGQQLAELLAKYLPASKARVTRAPHTKRVASLLSSGQLDLALVTKPIARALTADEPPFSDYGPIDLRVLANHPDFLLLARAEFPAHHAYQVAETLRTHGAELGFTLLSEATAQPPPHPGVIALLQGAPMPEPPAISEIDEHPHTH